MELRWARKSMPAPLKPLIKDEIPPGLQEALNFSSQRMESAIRVKGKESTGGNNK